MADFLLFCLASVGMTLILVRGSIFLSWRQFLASEAARIRRRREKKDLPPSFTLIEFFHELIECVQCTGFWCGVVCGLFLVTSDGHWNSLAETGTLAGIPYLFNRALMLLCCGAAGSFLAPLGDSLVEWMFCTRVLRSRELEDDNHRRAEATEQDEDRQVDMD